MTLSSLRTEVITKEDAIEVLKKTAQSRENREQLLLQTGYPAYTTQTGWLGYSDEKTKSLCKKYLDLGFTAFKIKVGQNLEADVEKCKLMRDLIGWENKLMVDANQVWDVNEAIRWMSVLAEFKPVWIEEPTSPDDVLGHAMIARALRPLGIKVASGEMCANRVMFKQFLQAKALDFCQIDSARIGGVNEILAVYLMAHKMNGASFFSLSLEDVAESVLNAMFRSSAGVSSHRRSRSLRNGAAFANVGLCVSQWDEARQSYRVRGSAARTL